MEIRLNDFRKQKIEYAKEFKIKDSNKRISIISIIATKDYLKISKKEEESNGYLPPFKYESIYSKEDLVNLNNVFMIYSSPSEIAMDLYTLLSKNSYEIIKDDSRIIFSFKLNSDIQKQIIIPLFLSTTQEDITINNARKLAEANIEINKLTERNNLYRNKILKLKEKFLHKKREMLAQLKLFKDLNKKFLGLERKMTQINDLNEKSKKYLSEKLDDMKNNLNGYGIDKIEDLKKEEKERFDNLSEKYNHMNKKIDENIIQYKTGYENIKNEFKEQEKKNMQYVFGKLGKLDEKLGIMDLDIKELNNKTDLINLSLQREREMKESSEIIINESEAKLILDPIRNKMNKEISKLIKIYQGTKDGDSAEDFHRKCDRVGNTIIIAKTEGGKRFGGFTPTPWDTKGNKTDQNTFVFSIDKMKIFEYKGKFYTTSGQSGNGPIFGSGRDIFIGRNFTQGKSSYTNTDSFNASFGGEGYELGDSKTGASYRLQELEVYEVKFN